MNEKKTVGRPKKEIEYTHTALSLLQKEGKWNIVSIKYNENGEVGEMELIPQDGQMEAVYNYKIMAANKVLPE